MVRNLQMHIVLAVGDTISKQVRVRKWHEQPLQLGPRSMERPSAQKNIHAEDFKKVRKALNKVHNVKWTNQDVRVPTVSWAYRTTCKNLSTQALPRLEYVGTTISPIVLGKLRPRMIAPVDMMVCGTLEVEIQQGSFRFQELEEERVQLRKKSALVYAKVKKLKDEIKQDFLSKKGQGDKAGCI